MIRVLLIHIYRPSAQDLICRTKNLLCALFWNRVRVVADALIEPILQIPPTVVRSFKTQRFTAQKRYGFGFYFPQVPRRLFSVGEVGFESVTDRDVGHFME